MNKENYLENFKLWLDSQANRVYSARTIRLLFRMVDEEHFKSDVLYLMEDLTEETTFDTFAFRLTQSPLFNGAIDKLLEDGVSQYEYAVIDKVKHIEYESYETGHYYTIKDVLQDLYGYSPLKHRLSDFDETVMNNFVLVGSYFPNATDYI